MIPLTGLYFFHKIMKYSFKYRILLVYWKIFQKEKYKIAMQFWRAFDNMSKDDKDLLVKAAMNGV